MNVIYVNGRISVLYSCCRHLWLICVDNDAMGQIRGTYFSTDSAISAANDLAGNLERGY